MVKVKSVLGACLVAMLFSAIGCTPGPAATDDVPNDGDAAVVLPFEAGDVSDAIDVAGDSPAMDVNAQDTSAPDVPAIDGSTQAGVTQCMVSFAGASAPYECYEWAYQHATEIPVRQTECSNFNIAGMTSTFMATGGCPRVGSVGCCVYADSSGAFCFYPPFTMSTAMASCHGTSTYMPPPP